MSYSTLRAFTNKLNTVYNALRTTRIYAEDLNLIGSNLEDHESRIGDLEGAPPVSGLAVLPATGAVDDSNTSFTFTEKPLIICINGISYIENAGWTWAVLTATLSTPVGSGGSIFGVK